MRRQPQQSSDGSVNFSSLRARLHELVTEVEPIRIPSRQMWEALQVQTSLGLPFDYAYYWALHFCRAPEKFRKRVRGVQYGGGALRPHPSSSRRGAGLDHARLDRTSGN